ncbi:MAG: 4-oxalocrotonate tautomerase [Rhodospirillaceae bacterium]|nr:4-oxalocrotonate tautomerase [Rhodospirillaceae bacterium]
MCRSPGKLVIIPVSNNGRIIMPFVNIRIVEGHSQERKDEISRRVVDTINDVTEIPKEAIWVVFQDITAEEWYVGNKSVKQLNEEAS